MAMIHPSKTAAVLSVVLCGALTTTTLAQEPDEPRPRPDPATHRERPARSAPRSSPDEETLPPPPPPPVAPGSSERTPGSFVAPPGLSEEARRSFREYPPGISMGPEEADSAGEAPAPRARSASPRSPAAVAPQRPEYVVEPPDLLLIEVLEALPGRPISGERLVRPDGRISLGFYGEIPIAGLTLPQIKERIVLHLRKFINDDILGLVELDPETAEPKRDAYGRIVLKDPRDTDRVFVDVTAYNSQNYYVLGDVMLPGRLPCTGGDTVLDVIQYAGGLLSSADKSHIRLIRSFPKGSPTQVLPIDYDEIAMGTDSSTNYAILPGDRLVIPGASTRRSTADAGSAASTPDGPRLDARAARASSSQTAPSLYFNRKTYVPDPNPTAKLEERIDAIEAKLDQLVEAAEEARPGPGDGPDERIQALERKLDAVIRMLEKNQDRPGGGPAGSAGAKGSHRLQLPVEPDRGADQTRPAMPGMTVPTLRPGPGPPSPGPRRPGPRQPRPSGAERSRPDRPAELRPDRQPAIPELPEDQSPFSAPPPDVLPEP